MNRRVTAGAGHGARRHRFRGLVGWRIPPWRLRVWDTASSTWGERVKHAGLDQSLACGDRRSTITLPIALCLVNMNATF